MVFGKEIRMPSDEIPGGVLYLNSLRLKRNKELSAHGRRACSDAAARLEFGESSAQWGEEERPTPRAQLLIGAVS
jgi:hypothetical protein